MNINKHLAGLLILLIPTAIFSSNKLKRKPFNVLFIAVDDLRPNIGCYNDSIAITPNIDHLSKKSVIFTNAYCQQAVCNPSRASILTGQRPDVIGVTNLVSHFREKSPDAVTLPQIFIANGYETVGIGKIFHGAKNTQDEVSWTRPSILNLSVKEDEYVLPENRKGGKAAAYEMTSFEDEAYEDGQIAREAIRSLREFKQSDKPFFLAVGFKKPHLPFCSPQKYWDLYDPSIFNDIYGSGKPENVPEIALHNSQELRGYNDISPTGEISGEKAKILRHGYYACISFVDAQLGKMIDELNRLGLQENTVIVLFGDNGYHLGEQDLWCKSTNFELDCRIPLMISAPGNSKPGAKSDAIVEAVDIYPTLLDLCGLKTKVELAGVSLRPILDNPSIEFKDAAFSQFIRPFSSISSGKQISHMGYSVRTRDWRYTAWYNKLTTSIDFSELYHMSNFSIEKVNVSGLEKYKKIEDELKRMVQDYQAGNYPKAFIIGTHKE